jgi:poly-gamma-glutamate synthesis protein (capsule biosynthesis protein)
MFNSPAELGHTLKDVGFTAVSTANNHSLDRKESGILQTIKHLDEAGLLHTGTFASPEERDEPLLLKKDGFTLALLSYTYGTNGIAIPDGKPYMINLIDPELIKEDIARAREKGADLVAVALHFGVEYQRQPNEAQKKTAEQCIQ